MSDYLGKDMRRVGKDDKEDKEEPEKEIKSMYFFDCLLLKF